VWVVRLAAPASETADHVRAEFLAEGMTPRTFADMTDGELAARSGYSTDDAARARSRDASVVLVDVDIADARVARSLRRLETAGCHIAHGGRWLSVVAGADKGTAARAWLAANPASAAGIIAAIGDSENDVPLCSAVEHAFVAMRDDGTHEPQLVALPGVHLLRRRGNAGWTEMIDALSALGAGVS
jgi:mannosyl-3-phosphoglycerate phosphatase